MNASNPVYFANVRTVSRGSGATAVAMGAYRHATSMRNEQTGQISNYSSKQSEVVHSEIALPEGAPKWAVDRYLGVDAAIASERLWNDIEVRESSHNHAATSQLAESFTFALPRVLPHEQQIELVRDYVSRELIAKGQVADWVIHDKGDGNPHAHVMVTRRDLGEHDHGKRIRDFQVRRSKTLSFRFAWAEVANEHLARAGFDLRIDHRKLSEQGIELGPISYSPHVEKGVEHGGEAYRVKQRVLAAREGNEGFLRENPDHILTVVAAGSPEFTREQVEEAFLKFLRPSFGKAQVEELMRAAMASDELVTTGEADYRDQPKYTTRTMLEMGRQLTRDVLQMRDSQLDVEVPNGEVLSETLSEEQRVAVEAMIDPRRITVVRGYAGAGKTYSMTEASRVWSARGVQVLGGAVSGKAVQELSGLHGDVATLAQWEAQWDRGILPERGNFVFFLDEAAMVGTSTASRFVTRVNALGGKVIPAGDEAQTTPINDTSPYVHMASLAGCVTIGEVRRQQRDLGDRQAVEQLSRGGAEVDRAIDHFAGQGAFRFERTEGQAIARLAMEYFEGVAPSEFGQVGSQRIALTHRNADVEDLNAAIRQQALKCGFVSDEGGITLERTGLQDSIELSVGDSVRFTKPYREGSVTKSSYGTIKGVGSDRLIVSVDGKPGVLEIDTSAFNHFDYGYAATVHKAQGMTVKGDVLVLFTKMFDRHLTDVAFSRHTEALKVYAAVNVGDDEAEANEVEALNKRREARGVSDPDAVLEPFFDLPEFETTTEAERKEALGFVKERARTSGLTFVRDADKLPTVRRGAPSLDELLSEGRVDRVVAAALPDAGIAVERTSITGDVHVHQQGQRMAGLLAGEYEPGMPIFADDLRGYLADPLKVVDDLLAESGVLKASDVAEKLAEVIKEPVTFARLYYQAMSHPELVVLSETGSEGEGRIYSSVSQVDHVTTLMDRSVRMAVTQRGFEGDLGVIDPGALRVVGAGLGGVGERVGGLDSLERFHVRLSSNSLPLPSVERDFEHACPSSEFLEPRAA